MRLCSAVDNPFAGEDRRHLAAWIADNDGLIKPYVAPPVPTFEEVRARILPAPPSIMDSSDIVAANEVVMPDSVNRTMIITELERSFAVGEWPIVLSLSLSGID